MLSRGETLGRNDSIVLQLKYQFITYYPSLKQAYLIELLKQDVYVKRVERLHNHSFIIIMMIIN